MDDAISRGAVLEILTNNIVISEDEIDLMEEVCHTIKVAPAIDAVPVVRCKDCRNYNPVLQECWYFQAIMAPVDYCSEGVRKDGEDDA